MQYIKKINKAKRMLLCLVILIICIEVTACSEYVDRGPEAEVMAKEYVEGKYGDVLSYAGLNEKVTGMINGDPYWEVYFTDKEGEEFTVCVCLSDDELYIDYETYYNHYIEPIMCDWLAGYLEEAGLEEFILYCTNNPFSTDWSVDYGVEEILENLMEKKETRDGWIRYCIAIPEREREMLDSGKLAKCLSDIKIYSEKILIRLSIYEDGVYDSWDEIEGYKSALEQIYLFEEDANE